MNHKIVELQTMFTGEVRQFVSIEREDGSFEVFAVDETNPRYVKFLEEMSDGNNKPE